MSASNLPPGVTDSMMPGNRPEDEAWENYLERWFAETEKQYGNLGDCEDEWTRYASDAYNRDNLSDEAIAKEVKALEGEALRMMRILKDY